MSKFPESTKFRTSEKFKERIIFLKNDNECSSNQDFADLVGVSVPVISKAINFGIVPTVRMLIKIADKLELSFNYLLGLTDINEFIGSAAPTTFHKRLKELIDSKKLDYSKMGFQRTYLYEWIKEGTYPSVDYVLDLANYYNVSPDYLLGRTDYKN